MPPKTIYIIRHCDKPLLKVNDKGGCTEQGYIRAKLLAGLTGTCEITNLNTCNNFCSGTYSGGFWQKILGNDKPTALYAAVSNTDSSYASDKNLKNRGIKCSTANRCCFILNPTSNRYNLSINADGGTFCDTEGSLLGTYILNQPTNNNGTIIIAWEHHDIPNLINSLGADPEFLNWPDDAANRFDIVFKLDYTKNLKNPEVTISTQNLGLEGDSNKIPDFKRKIYTSSSNKSILWICITIIVVLVLILFLFIKYKKHYF
jgi:hypothetical protein